ncbi:D-alanyl-lipoteichoic acid biosynthesis protein DltD, partial [Streptococcus pneumoniae]
KGIVQKLSKGEELSEVDQVAIDIFARFNEKQSALFGQFSIRGKLKYKEHVENYLKDLPDQFSYDELEKIVRKDAEANTTNNDMGMENHF